MKAIHFEWEADFVVNKDVKKTVEQALQQTFNDDKVNLTAPCHSGTVTATLKPVGPTLSEVAGNISCKCGKVYCDIETSDNGNHVSFTTLKR